MKPKPPTRIFLTGATGFVGRIVLSRFLEQDDLEITCLVRDRRRLDAGIVANHSLKLVEADLSDSSALEASVAQADIVVHLAAATGSANDEELQQVNVGGTEALVAACQKSKIRYFLHVSSIAARFDNLRHYPYGRSKRESERVLATSGLPFGILRPTIVIGQGSPVLLSLRKLAGLPVIPLFGGGRTLIQPVAVRDVANAIEYMIRKPDTHQSITEFGGPEALTFRDFIERIRLSTMNKAAAMIPVPAAPVQLLLAALRTIAGDRLPISPGQIAPFVNNGVASTNPVYERLKPGMLSIDEMLSDIRDGN